MPSPRDRQHILIRREPKAEPFTTPRSARGKKTPAIDDRPAHAATLSRQLHGAESIAEGLRTAAGFTIHGAQPGTYLQFESQPAVSLDPQKLEDRRAGIETVNLTIATRSDDERVIERATVFVPDGALGVFLGKLEKYASLEPARPGERRHHDLFDRIAEVRLAALREFWTDASQAFPEPNELCWWEVWLRRTTKAPNRELERLAEFAEHQGLQLGERRLEIGDRTIVHVRGSARQLAASAVVLGDLAELRGVRETAGFFESLDRAEQADWANELLGRTTFFAPATVRVCLLDTGVNRGHPLLDPALAPRDLHACDPQWGAADHHGHGTEMAGLAVFGDLTEALASRAPIVVRHRLESVKILPPPPNVNSEHMYASVTAEATSRVEVGGGRVRRVFSMAVTAGAESGAGLPTTWSTAIDALAAGRSFDTGTQGLEYLGPAEAGAHRLFVLSAGNVPPEDHERGAGYLEVCDLHPVEDPAQAWNALTVGAMTELDQIADPEWQGWNALAPHGDLSPYSSTSTEFGRGWPIKPDVVFEGGNLAADAAGNVDSGVPDLNLLSTSHEIQRRMFVTTNATSAACAQVARMAAQIHAEYPSFWPETVRGLIVHAAEWTPAMRERLPGDRKSDVLTLHRRYGFGVPRLDRALRSAKDALTLIVQSSIRPFEQRGSQGVTREMHVHELPWPVDVLAELGEAKVRVRVTLSYFIEPMPGRRGYARRYAYASHGLRFELRRSEETTDQMRARLNKRARDEEEGRRDKAPEDKGWSLGEKSRWTGSLHSDRWEGTAAALAARGVVAVYPVGGWWKEQPKSDRSEHGARYALLLSIETEGVEADVWTPVAQQVDVVVGRD